MKDYVLEIRPPTCDPRASGERALEPSELREFRRLVAQLRWPVHLVMPEFLYSVSALAQRVSKAQVKDFRQARDTLKEVQQAATRGQAILKFERLQKDAILVSFFDASLGKAADHTAQRGEVHFLADASVLQGQGKACILEFHSNKIARVVRSSLAAEGASMAACTDRLVYNMKLYDVLKNGSLEVSPTWRRELGGIGHIVTDARSLFDHVKGSSMLATERQVSLDILEVRQLVQEGVLDLHWVPTWRQYADVLTKSMADELYGHLRCKGLINVIQTPADQLEEDRRAALRRAQRERRKLRMKEQHSFLSM